MILGDNCMVAWCILDTCVAVLPPCGQQQGDVALKVHVARVCFKCFIGMLQVFHMDIAKVDWDLAYVANAFILIIVYIHTLYKCIAPHGPGHLEEVLKIHRH
jgi:hypothetical protein